MTSHIGIIIIIRIRSSSNSTVIGVVEIAEVGAASSVVAVEVVAAAAII
jgi:hypothetical protein